jgi:enoyl-CoA hydratase/carnithine racemase
LIAAKEKAGHGQFGAWLSAEFEMGFTTARQFMRVAERFGAESAKFADLKPSVLYLLASPTVPEDDAQALAAKLAAKEIENTVAATKAAIQKAREDALEEARKAIEAAEERATKAGAGLHCGRPHADGRSEASRSAAGAHL